MLTTELANWNILGHKKNNLSGVVKIKAYFEWVKKIIGVQANISLKNCLLLIFQRLHSNDRKGIFLREKQCVESERNNSCKILDTEKSWKRVNWMSRPGKTEKSVDYGKTV